MAGQNTPVERAQKTSLLTSITRHVDVVLAVMIVLVIAILVLPLPPRLLDFLLAFNIALSLVVLIATMYITKPLELSVFPGLLLILTLFRLSLNVASTRLILGNAYAGEVIESFGNFVVGGNYVVGFIIFAILVIIQFVVITKGAGRVAEVAARFTLDAMPGKQMAIDADLNAGLISEDDARRRRDLIAKEADFYGAMDGASKFVRGDAVAAVLITLINVIGGFIIGVAQMGMSLTDALKTYTLLSIGDGLVTQVPALIIATSAGIIVTRAASESNLGHDLSRQLGSHPKAILIAAVMLLVLGIVPGMPTLPFMLLGGAGSVIAYSQIKEKKQIGDTIPDAKAPAAPPTEKVEDLLKVDILEIEIGYGLISLVDNSRGNDLLDRITLIRKQVAGELGIIVPPIRIRDNVKLKPNQYQIKIKGIPLASSILYPDQYLAINPGTVRDPLAGLEVKEPAFNLSALWVDESQKDLAEKKGYTVVETTAVLATHLTELIKSNASELLTRQEVSKLIENVKTENPTLIEELIPNQLGVGQIQHVLQNLLAERIPIKDLPTILEALADHAGTTKDTDILSEYARYALARTITTLNLNDDESIKVITLDHQLEKLIADSVQNTKQGILAIVPPDVAQKIVNNVLDATNESMAAGFSPVILTSPNIRLAFRRLIAPAVPRAGVISFNELIPNLEIESILTVRMPDEN